MAELCERRRCVDTELYDAALLLCAEFLKKF